MFTNRYVANIILIGLVLLSVVFAFYDSVDKLALTWLNSNTYGHGFLILPIVLWLVDRKAYLLKDITAQPSRIAIIFVGLFSFLWFISVLMYVNVIEQFVLFTLLIVLTWAFFGWKIVNAIKFPLFFLYFSIPIGDFLIPYLQFITADISVYLIQILNIPVFRDGMYIQIPNGNFLVAEACSGIRFLISTVTIGVLFSYLNFTKVYKKILFVFLCFVVAIVGNGIRAFLMILIGHLSNMKAAVGFDHLVYGWVFFSIIIVILFVIGSYMSDPEEDIKTNDTIKSNTTNIQVFPSAAFILLIAMALFIGPALNYKYHDYLSEMSVKNTAEKTKVSETGDIKKAWLPKYPDADIKHSSTIKLNGSAIDTFFAKYYVENDEKEIISYKNSLFDLEKWSLKSLSSNSVIDSRGREIPYTNYTIVNLKGKERQIRLTYKVNNVLVANKIHFKLLQLINKIMMKDFGGEVIVISTSEKHHADTILNQFMIENFDSVASSTTLPN